MDNVGARIWELIEQQHDMPTVVAAIAGWYGAPPDRVASDLGTLVEQLIEEGLLVASPEEAGAAAEPVEAAADGPLVYQTPALHVYRDMGNLLALDPPTPGIDDLMFKDGKSR